MERLHCYNCHEDDPTLLLNLFGYDVCQLCKSKLGLLQDKTIKKHQANSERRALESEDHIPLFHEEIQRRLSTMDKDYISKRIKLLHILNRLDLLY